MRVPLLAWPRYCDRSRFAHSAAAYQQLSAVPRYFNTRHPGILRPLLIHSPGSPYTTPPSQLAASGRVKAFCGSTSAFHLAFASTALGYQHPAVAQPLPPSLHTSTTLLVLPRPLCVASHQVRRSTFFHSPTIPVASRYHSCPFMYLSTQLRTWRVASFSLSI